MNVCQTGAEQRPALRAIDICKVEDPPAGPFFLDGRASLGIAATYSSSSLSASVCCTRTFLL